MPLRDYQEEAVKSVFKEWEDNVSTLVVAATGTGKTQIFCEVIRRSAPKRALILCHRSELIWQAVKRIEAFGLEASVEMADLRASTSLFTKSPVVVSTIQTQCSGNDGEGRMQRFDPMDFDTVVVDEAHHATAETWTRTLAYYRQNPALRILGVTATPDRADEEALGQVFESVAFDYEILDAINDGWLVPVEQQMVEIEDLDFSAIRTTAGDLNGADLARIMEAEENLQGIASATLEIIGNRRTMVFTVSVKQAEMLSDIFNRHKPHMSDWVCGKTPKEDRKERLEKFDKGETQIMVNVGVLTEGYDSPGVECIVMGRPTKSRSLYSQMVGRSTRPLPGLVDGIAEKEDRKMAIAASPKPSCLIIDFAGNAGRHKLMSTADILGGKSSDEAIEAAKERATRQGGVVNMVEIIAEEEERLRREMEERRQKEAARKARLIGKATFTARNINPFDAFGLNPEKSRGWDSGKQLSEKQRMILLKSGVNPEGMAYHAAKQLLNEQFRRWNNKLCTLKQANLLRKHGYETKEMPMKTASSLIDALAKNGWSRSKAEAAAKQPDLAPAPVARRAEFGTEDSLL